MEAATSLLQLPRDFPVEVWKGIADSMHVYDWARISTVSRTSLQVLPREVLIGHMDGEDLSGCLRWVMKRCREAETMDIDMTDIACKDLAESMIAGSHHLKHLQTLVLCFTPYLCLESKVGFDEAELPWLAQFLAGAPELRSLSLHQVRIDVTMLTMLKAQLTELRLGFSLPFPMGACHKLQGLRSLETLHLYAVYNSTIDEDIVKISGLDLTGCCKLRELHMSLLEPEKLSVPPGCFVSIERDILFLNRRKWEGAAALYNECALFSNRYSSQYANLDQDLLINRPRLAGTLGWLSQVACPNLTKLVLNYPKLLSMRRPLRITDCLKSLRHLEVISSSVYVVFEESVQLEKLVLEARKNVNIALANISHFAAGLQYVRMRWISCCTTTYALATALRNGEEWCVPPYWNTTFFFSRDNENDGGRVNNDD